MRTLTLCLLLLGLIASVAGGEGLSLDQRAPAKPPGSRTPFPLVPRTQGDTVADPFIIPALPFAAAGSTSGFNNDYDVACPFAGSTSPDVVYAYYAAEAGPVTIDLCESTYDTKVYVFENVAGNVIACNDDYCGIQSYLAEVFLEAGNTYYIVIDGYGGTVVLYDMEVLPYIPCVIECPAGAIAEGEPDCHDEYVDVYNAGCGSSPPLFQWLSPSPDPIVVCGTTGVFHAWGDLYDDTDWFEIYRATPAEICLAGDAEIPCTFLMIDGRYGCENAAIVAGGTVGPCDPDSDFCEACDAGSWWIRVAPSEPHEDYPCGSGYWLEITGHTPGASSVPEQDPFAGTTWGSIKALFR